MRAVRQFNVVPAIPPRLAALGSLANNIHWTWDRRTQALFAQLLKDSPVSWSGRTRTSLTSQAVYPRVEPGPLRTWVGVGGSPESVVRAARYGLPLTLAIIGGNPRRFRSYVDLYHQSLKRYEQPMQAVAVHSPGYVANTDEEAKADLWPHYQAMMARIGRERGWPPPSQAPP